VFALVGLGTALLGPSSLANADGFYGLGQIVDFRDTGDATPYLRQGWASPTEEGTRTAGTVADLVFPPRLSTKDSLGLRVDGAPIFADGEDKFWIDLLANGTRAMRYEFQRGQGPEPLVAVLPYLRDNHDAPLHVTLVVGADHTKPGRAGASAFQVQTLTLN
jgi:hypothetical protein